MAHILLGAPDGKGDPGRGLFRVRISEVDEMIRYRFEAEDTGSKEGGLWPQEFWLEG